MDLNTTTPTNLSEELKTSIKDRVSIRTMLLVVVAFLTGLGLLAIYASSSIPIYHETGDSLHYFRKQAVVAVVGFLTIFVMGHIPFRWIEKSSLYLVLASIILLCLLKLRP